MALDANLFTLVLTPVKGQPTLVDLADPQGEVHYRKRLVSAQPTYEMSIFDPHTDALLCSVKGTSPFAKQKTFELFNPNVTVSFQNTGTLSFKWSFTWEEMEFEWRKEACYLIRKPDPPVIVCSCDAPQTARRSAMQILDYNLQRFDIEDRKGLEICIIAGLLTFYDQIDENNRQKQQGGQKNATPTPTPALPLPPKLSPQPSSESIAVTKDLPPPPPAPIPRDGNEIYIVEDVPISDYVQQCAELLKDDSILFIILRAQTISTVGKCVQVAEATKRYIYRTTEDDQELHQYVTTDEQAKGRGKGKHRINLDEPANKHDYQPPGPPQSLTIHLSKIPMPELQPKAAPKPPPTRVSPTGGAFAPSPPGKLSPPSNPGRSQKPEKGKGRAPPDDGEWEQWPDEKATAKSKGKGRASPPPTVSPRPDKGKGKERPLSMFPTSSPNPIDTKPDKGKGRADGKVHKLSPSVPHLKIDTSGQQPNTAPLQRPQSQPPQGYARPPGPPQPSQQYPMPPQSGTYLQPSPQPYGISPAPYAVYGPPNGPPQGGSYLSPYPGMPPQQPQQGGGLFGKLFRPSSR